MATTRWFLTEAEYDSWRETQPARSLLYAELYTHVGHGVMGFLPHTCTACSFLQYMLKAMQVEPRGARCRHDVRLDVEDCDVGC